MKIAENIIHVNFIKIQEKLLVFVKLKIIFFRINLLYQPIMIDIVNKAIVKFIYENWSANHVVWSVSFISYVSQIEFMILAHESQIELCIILYLV